MRPFIKATLLLCLAFVGYVLLLAGLTMLGWGRHGTPPTDLTFLHLDVIFEPTSSLWAAHMQNLAVACAGLGCMMLAVVLLVRTAIASRRSQLNRVA